MVGSNSDLPPISWASLIIGFVSFAFTVSTFVRVVLGNIRTLGSAPTEVSFYLSNLKQELFEERVHLRRARRRAERYMRRCRREGRGIPSWDAAPTIRLLEGTVRQLCKEFKELEKPFLIDKQDRGVGGGEKGETADKEWDDYMDGGFEQDYGTVTLYHRFSWLRRKAAIQALGVSLERLQIRRIGRETTDALTEIKNLKSGLQELRLIPGADDGGTGGGATKGSGGGGADGGGSGGTRRRRTSQKRGRKPEPSYSESESSESSRSDVEREKVERVHVRRSSRYRR